MLFSVQSLGDALKTPMLPLTFALIEDSWDDYEFNTLYLLKYCDSDCVIYNIGGVKIGQFQFPPLKTKGINRPEIGKEFDSLEKNFFSLGQDSSYYARLCRLGAPGIEALESLRDCALNKDLFESALSEKVMKDSLLRFAKEFTVRNQFMRIVKGEPELTDFSFEYHSPKLDIENENEPFIIPFHVKTGVNPPTNVHVLVGRNGVGKSSLLYSMTKAFVFPEDIKGNGYFLNLIDGPPLPFANLLRISFSGFDSFPELPKKKEFSDIGLNRFNDGDSTEEVAQSASEIAHHFKSLARECQQGEKGIRWKTALKVLESDPLFAEMKISDLAAPASEATLAPEQLFSQLSSGHKIVLLITAALVHKVDERTLVLLDEPEAHLHPPLLSALVRVISTLLVSRNGVAIIATHSPVVLQEVPKSCVWKIERYGSVQLKESLELETFGENVGTLTQEVFGLEVRQSGFHNILYEKVCSGLSYKAILEAFDHQLGFEARSILRSLIATREETCNDEKNID